MQYNRCAKMSSSAEIELVLILLVAIFQASSCACRQSYVTLCDSFDDLKTNPNNKEWSEVMIGSYESSANETVILMNVLTFDNFNSLRSLQVVRRISKLQLKYGYQCTYHLANFKLWSFYGNVFTNIESYHFPLVEVEKFSLVNNKIETIQKDALTYQEAEIFELSDNLLEDIVKGALPSTEKTKVITIRNNRLTHIEPGSFPSNLSSLNLDNNKLRFIENGVLDSLTALKELTLSKNKFRRVPDVSHLKELIVLDISSNIIGTIDAGTFEPLHKLLLLDLSNNKIEQKNILDILLAPRKQPKMTISIAFNSLRGLNLTDVALTKEELMLFGNPWDCTDWENLSRSLLQHQNQCDLKHFSSGNLPYCVNYKSESVDFDYGWKEQIQRFHHSVENGAKMDCQLAPNKFEFLYPVSSVCVA